jgi:hypothetical protein
LRQFFSLSVKPTEEIHKFLSKDFLKADDIDDEIRRSLGLHLGEDRKTAWSEEVTAEFQARKELKEKVIAQLLGESKETA